MIAENREPAALHPPGILVVDDESSIRHFLRLGLERHGFRIVLADGGRQALDLYRQQQQAIAVVLLDVRMPGLDGPETFDQLRQLNPEVRVCFMSGDTGEYEAGALRARGACDFVSKPFRLEDLARRLWLLAQGATAELISTGKS